MIYMTVPEGDLTPGLETKLSLLSLRQSHFWNFVHKYSCLSHPLVAKFLELQS